MYWSTEDFPRLVNGHSGFVPRSLEKVRSETKAFPDERSAALLQSIGVRTVIVHPELRVRVQSRSRRNPTGSGLTIDVAEDSRPVIYPIGP